MFIKVTGIKQLETVENLAREIWTEHYTPIIGKDQVSYMLDKFQSQSSISEQIGNGIEYYLIQDKKLPIGYLAVQAKESELFLSKIYILSSMRGKGFGRKAIDFVANIAKSRKLGKVTLTVNKNNLNSIKAYEKAGFVNKGSIVQDIGNGFIMDDYRMEKIVCNSLHRHYTIHSGQIREAELTRKVF